MPEPLKPERATVTPGRDASSSASSDLDETAPATPGVGSDVPTFGPPTEVGDVGTIGPYRVVKALGEGGMGAVYLALDTRLNRKLAMKVMLPKFAAEPAARERFLREARAAAGIKHDNVVTVYEADERAGVPYIAMELLEGLPLDAFLSKKGLPPLPNAVRIARDAAMGLAAAHAAGLIHRDIKPANLWLESPSGRVKILDFGLAKPLGADVELTRSGAVIGTPAYMSPEQASGRPVDARTDLYSLGAVLYRLATGQNPLAAPNIMSLMYALANDEPVPVRDLNPGVPEALAQLVGDLLAKNPEHRPQTAAEVARRLRAVLDQMRGTPRPASGGASRADNSGSLTVEANTAPYQPPVGVPMQASAATEDAIAHLTDDDQTVGAAAAKANRTKGVVVLLAVAGGSVLLAAAASLLAALLTGWRGGATGGGTLELPPEPERALRVADSKRASDWIDLLAMDESEAVRPEGAKPWTRFGGKLISSAEPGWYVDGLPVRPTGSYTLAAEVVFEKGDDCFGLILPVGATFVLFAINTQGGTARGFGLIDGRSPPHPLNPTHLIRPPAEVGKPVRLSATVAVTGDRAALSGVVDAERPIRWEGAVSALSLDRAWFATPDRLGVAAYRSEWTILSLKLKCLDGEVMFLNRGGASNRPRPPAKK